MRGTSEVQTYAEMFYKEIQKRNKKKHEEDAWCPSTGMESDLYIVVTNTCKEIFSVK